MQDQFQREELLIEKENLEKLHNSKVIVYGIGGVGSFVVEGLVRAGIEDITLVDFDTIDITNLNRQIHALHSTIGEYKADVMKKRILDINPQAKVEVYDKKLENEENLINKSYSYVIDAVDTVSTKIKLIGKSKKENVPIISAMGTGNKLNPSFFEIKDINKTSVCPLAKVIRKELRERNIKNVKVLYSKETPIERRNKEIISSISYMPSIAGLMIAGEVIRDIINL